MYDIIGDVHGHGYELITLLEKLGYEDLGKGYRHKSRKVIFLGDFIDRGEDLAQHKLVLNTVMPMVSQGHALAVMGNHEFNALAYHTEHNGDFLRPHTKKNTEQHQAFLNEYPEDSVEKQEVLEFFFSLPLWLDTGDLRIVHACWDENHMKVLKTYCPSRQIDRDTLVEASTRGSSVYSAIEVLLKGVEVTLPDEQKFKDTKGHERFAIRVCWWKQDSITFADAAISDGRELGSIGAKVLPHKMLGYEHSLPPCFIGHYQLSGNPRPLGKNIACVDYSVSRNDGKLVAYRWDGEQILDEKKFVYQEKIGSNVQD
jgi:hypothetical protein